jgi:hypothetical protein
MRIKPFLFLTCFILTVMLFLLSTCESIGFLTIPKTSLDPDFTYSASIGTTPLPSPTSTKTKTQTNTPAPTAENISTANITPTVTPTPFFGFEDARVYQSYADYFGTIFYFIVPGVAAPYYGTVDGYDLTCEPDPSLENVLICRSDENLFGTNLKDFEFFADQDHTFLVYEGTIITYLDQTPSTPELADLIWPQADFTTADVTWGYDPPNCPSRGLNLTCEIEYRRYDDNSCLVGMSCFDSCGFYYSVDTIKNKSGAYSFSGPCW